MATTSKAPETGALGAIDRYFHVSARGSTIARELRGGLVTFFTMGYIVVLNPLIIGFVKDADGNYLGGGAEPNLPAIAAGTALIAGIMTILMGAVANYPMAIAAGLGLNAFVAYAVASEMTWADAMGLVVLEGIIILVLVLTGFREAVFSAVPGDLKVAISVGIGLFIALVGLIDAGFIRRANSGRIPVELGVGGVLTGWPTLVFVVGVMMIFALWARRVKGTIVITILAMTVFAMVIEAIGKIGPMVSDDEVHPEGWGLNVPAWPDSITPINFATLGEFNLFGSFERIGTVSTILFIFTLLLTDFFDTLGTMTAVGSGAGLLDEKGAPPNARQILAVDSIAAAAGGAAGVSSNTSYVESAAGVGEGARTGLASVFTGVLFLLSILFSPLTTIIPQEAAVPALLLVGFLMMQQIGDIDWTDIEIAAPSFLTIILMPFTFSVAIGIGAGFILYVVIKVVRGKAGQVRPMVWLTAELFLLFFIVPLIQDALGH